VDPTLDWIVRGALSLLLGAAASHKLRGWVAFRASLADYRLLPEVTLSAVASGLPACEIGLGLALLLPSQRAAAGVATAALLLVYASAIGINLARGRRHIDCGCTASRGGSPLSGWLVARNLALAAAALGSALPVATRPWVWLDGFTVVAGIAVLATLYAALDGLLANAPALAGLRS